MVPAAAPLPQALMGIEEFLHRERTRMLRITRSFLEWLQNDAAEVSPEEQQRRFAILRLRVNDHLSQLDLFSNIVVQRSESGVGLWLSGLDVAAADALRLNDGRLGRAVPIVCYLDRGPGAAIRRARTRLPGNVLNPVAIIRMPRERMVGLGIASSLFHEVGHQGAALLELVPALRAAVDRLAASTDRDRAFAWTCWSRWMSEVVADFWASARLGVGATLGLIGVVNLPRAFVFRVNLNDPHPFPWIRVLLSCALGNHLYPDRQWAAVERVWRQLYPLSGVPDKVREVIDRLLPTLPTLATLLAEFQPSPLDGTSLSAALAHPSRHPRNLRHLRDQATADPALAARLSPALRFALLAQARWDGTLSAAAEIREVDAMLTTWARESTFRVAHASAHQQQVTGRAALSREVVPT
ncbi:hypothetical protein [Micromonospora cathayae]|uniref:HEXXH motif-containing protein n=1 Tax=Micromonospora cathayae TaxID=3028804 RepID=A0ABY7ZLX1_9ACTN|nr:hypothetical protein [Micromonospora sp. HUAS 3]WDZ82899.1 hypothetical protein PVK37_20765 [Micromonospora sp. HUAS 3]